MFAFKIAETTIIRNLPTHRVSSKVDKIVGRQTRPLTYGRTDIWSRFMWSLLVSGDDWWSNE